MRIGAFRVQKDYEIRPKTGQEHSPPETGRELPYHGRFCLPRPRVTKWISNQNLLVMCQLRLFTATKIWRRENVSIICHSRLLTATKICRTRNVPIVCCLTLFSANGKHVRNLSKIHIKLLPKKLRCGLAYAVSCRGQDG